MESNKIRLLILYSFYDLLCLFKDPVKINKKEKRKKCCHLSLKPLREVMCPVSGVQGVQSNDFVVQRKKWILLKIEGGKRNFFREKWSNLPRAARPGRQPSLVYPAHLACRSVFSGEKWSNLPRAARPGRQPSLVYPVHLACSETD